MINGTEDDRIPADLAGASQDCGSATASSSCTCGTKCPKDVAGRLEDAPDLPGQSRALLSGGRLAGCPAIRFHLSHWCGRRDSNPHPL